MPEPISDNAARFAQHRGLSWRKSSFSFANGDCVEVGSRLAAGVAVRDTMHHGAGPRLVFTPDAWRSFVAGVKHGCATH